MPIAPLQSGLHLHADDTSPGGGRFLIEKPLSAGGFAITYLAYDQQTGDRCVIKELAIDQLMVRSGADMVPLPGRDGDVAIWVQKVEKEANTLHRLRNAGVVPIRTTWRENGTAYFAMDFIDGIELPAEPTAGAGWATWEPVALKFLAALGAIHAEGLVHGDIKPANILVDREGNPVIIDFGTARSTEEAKKTRLTTVAMTPGYCPPELAVRDRAREMGPWSDLYSWSLSVMGLVIRHRGIDGAPLDTSARVALAQHGLAEAGMGAETASVLREAAVPEPWIAVLMACVALEPSARPQSAAAVMASLQPAPVARSLPPVPQKVAAPEPAPVAAEPAPAPAPAAATTSTAEDAASRAAAAAARYDSLSPQPKPAGSRKALVTVLAFGAVAAVGIALVVGMRGARSSHDDDAAADYNLTETAAPAAEPAAAAPAPPAAAPAHEAQAAPPQPSCGDGKWMENGTCTGCPVGLTFIKGSTFQMETSAYGQKVTIGYDYCFGIGETSNPTYSKLTNLYPSMNAAADHSVENVTFDEAKAFANARSADENFRPCYFGGRLDLTCDGFRLPSEAEWEFAAKTTVPWQPLSPGDSGAPWTLENAYGNTQISSHGKRRKTVPNPWGIYDALGNVAEYVTKMEGCNTNAGIFVTAPTSSPAESGGNVVVRGGSVAHSYLQARVDERIPIEGGGQRPYPWLGIRVVKNIPSSLPSAQKISATCNSPVTTVAMP